MDDPANEPDLDPDAEHHTPRWVKVATAVVLVLVVLFVVLQLTGVAPEHGPGLHGVVALGGVAR